MSKTYAVTVRATNEATSLVLAPFASRPSRRRQRAGTMVRAFSLHTLILQHRPACYELSNVHYSKTGVERLLYATYSFLFVACAPVLACELRL